MGGFEIFFLYFTKHFTISLVLADERERIRKGKIIDIKAEVIEIVPMTWKRKKLIDSVSFGPWSTTE
jgi:hypothetical protein